MINAHSTPDEVLEAEQSLRARMDAAQPGLHVARQRLRRDEADLGVTYLPLPNRLINALHDAYADGDSDRDIVALVSRMFGAQDGELAHLPHPFVPETAENQEHQ